MTLEEETKEADLRARARVEDALDVASTMHTHFSKSLLPEDVIAIAGLLLRQQDNERNRRTKYPPRTERTG